MSSLRVDFHVDLQCKMQAYNLGVHGISVSIDGLTLFFPSQKEYADFLTRFVTAYAMAANA